jgi:hypothetical protein
MKHTSLVRTSLIAALLAAGGACAAEMTLFSSTNFGGSDITIRGEARNLDGTGFNDRAASAIVRSGRWEVCTDANFSGQCVILGPGDYARLNDPLFRRISSAREIAPYALDDRRYYRYGAYEPPAVTYAPPVVTYAPPVVTYAPPVVAYDPPVDRGRYSALEIYTRPSFRGGTMKFDRNATTLDKAATDEGVGSLVVREGTWELCTGVYFNGECRVYEPGSYASLGSFDRARVGSLRRVG